MAAEQFDPCVAAKIFKDPHLSFAYGGTADFRGRHNALYNFLSTPRLSVNVRTEEALFQLHDGALMVNGTFLVEAHLVAKLDATSPAGAAAAAASSRAAAAAAALTALAPCAPDAATLATRATVSAVAAPTSDAVTAVGRAAGTSRAARAARASAASAGPRAAARSPAAPSIATSAASAAAGPTTAACAPFRPSPAAKPAVLQVSLYQCTPYLTPSSSICHSPARVTLSLVPRSETEFPKSNRDGGSSGHQCEA